MAGVKRPRARVLGEQAAVTELIRLGHDVRAARVRRRLTQQALADRVAMSRSGLAAIETGKAGGAPIRIWFALGEALDMPLRAEFGRDSRSEPSDAGHLAIQELVLRLGRRVGYTGTFEIPTRPTDPAHATDVRLVDSVHRRLLLVECWNTLDSIGGAARSSDRKRVETEALATALGDDGGPFQVGVCWVIRATRRNRELLRRYPHIFASRFPGPSGAWVRALVDGAVVPSEPGLVWCDVRATKLFAHRWTDHRN
jgi:transcriptional regulator with XRE-family HTH domain